jgi:hypothetical protein
MSHAKQLLCVTVLTNGLELRGTFQTTKVPFHTIISEGPERYSIWQAKCLICGFNRQESLFSSTFCKSSFSSWSKSVSTYQPGFFTNTSTTARFTISNRTTATAVIVAPFNTSTSTRRPPTPSDTSCVTDVITQECRNRHARLKCHFEFVNQAVRSLNCNINIQ